MKITVSGKQINIGSALQEYVESELTERVTKYFEDAISADVVFTKERYLFCVDVFVNDGTGVHNLITSHGENDDPHAAFETAAEKMEHRLRRYKDRLKDHHHMRATKALELDRFASTKRVLSSKEEDAQKVDEENASPLIIAEKNVNIDTLTVSDAVMIMDLSDLPALMFVNKKTGTVNVVYRRDDGNISWVDSNAMIQATPKEGAA